MSNQTTETYKEKAKQARRDVLKLIHKAQTSHAASNLSVLDIATVLYENLKPEDAVVWSAGWKAATIYYFLNKQGKITDEELAKFPNEPYYGLAETTVNGVLCNGGAVGHGTPIAVGMAYGKKLSGEAGTIYCILSDGELNEGTVWESAMLASHLKLDNLVFIIDKNGWQAMGKTKEVINLPFLSDIWLGFGWTVDEIDGHNFEQLHESLVSNFDPNVSRLTGPTVIIANTVKGKGISFMENHLLYHYRHVDDNDFAKAMEELK